MDYYKYKNINHYCFDDVKSVIVCGDIHGEYNEIINKICVQYAITNSVIIFAGDCGFGFHKYGYYENIYNKNKDRLNKSNNYLVFVRGNHDNPEYFNETNIKFDRFMTIPDYSIVESCGHTILCIGGAVSIDRQDRIEKETKEFIKSQSYKNTHINVDKLSPTYWWKDELPVYNPDLLKEIYEICIVDTVITHTAPKFCEKISKDGVEYWFKKDKDLQDDLNKEREVLTSIYNDLKDNMQPLTHWYYGHFHKSWFSNIDGCHFHMLDINQLQEIR